MTRPLPNLSGTRSRINSAGYPTYPTYPTYLEELWGGGRSGVLKRFSELVGLVGQVGQHLILAR